MKAAALFAVLAGVISAAALLALAYTRNPDLDATLHHPSLQAEVRVVRDDWGVPHIQAENETDAYFALGYVMAQDRLFQMDLLRRLARGELAAILGPPLARIDKIIRTFQLRAKAEIIFERNTSATPEIRAAAQAFTDGINHCMQTEPRPFECVVLQIPEEPFTPVDCITVAAILPITFAEGLREDLLASMLKQRHPDLPIDDLFPGYSREIPITIMESLDEAKRYFEENRKTTQAPARNDPVACLDALRVWLDPLADISRRFGPSLGSNSWVLGPSRTVSGKPVLANDPHIGFTNPSVWYEAHLQYGEFENYGYHLPLIPFPLMGHNRHHAWGLTMFANDDTDLYVETFKPDDPNKVMFKGEWVDVTVRNETISVRFGKDQPCAIRVTPHGPVITDLYRLIAGYDGPDIAMSWVWQNVEYTDLTGVYGMSRARSYDDFEKAVSYITSPGLNISYIDCDGNIAWWAAGKIPIRPKHVNSKELLDGASGKDELMGFVPFEQNPHLKNPPCGYIVTANNLSTIKPVGPIELIEGYWQPSDRAARIEELIESKECWSVDELKVMQFDDLCCTAPPIVDRIVEAVRGSNAALSESEQQALDALAAWDLKHDTASKGACVFHCTCDSILHHMLIDEMGEDLFANYTPLGDQWNSFKYVMQEEALPFWDDVTTPEKETRQDIVLRAFREAVTELSGRMGSVDQWSWGAIHTMEFKHPFGYLPLLGRIFNVGPFPSTGAGDVVNNMLYAGGGNYEVVAGPSTRRLIDYGDIEHSLTVLPTGNSGNFMSPHYGDQASLFMSGQYREARFTRSQIDSHKKHEMCFLPAQ